MGNTYTTATLFSGSNKAAYVFTNATDGTAESANAKIDISGLTGTPTKVKINNVVFNCSGMSVKILFDHDTDDAVLVLSGDGSYDFTPYGGLHDPASTGGTGDVLFTTIGHTDGDTYNVMMEISW